MPRPVNPDVQCDYKLDGREVWLRRRRKDGTEYKLRLTVGDRCPNLAIISKMRNGTMRHRCHEHIGEDWQDGGD